MGKKLIDELRDKVRKKHHCVLEESKKIQATLSTIQHRVDAINEEATAVADSLLKERNKEKLKGKYTDVMQRLEQCSNVLFLINKSLPGDAEEDGDSSSSSDSDGDDPVGGATSTPQHSHHTKPDLSPSFIPDTSSQFTLQDQSKLGLTAVFKEDGVVVKQEESEGPSVIKGQERNNTAVVKGEEETEVVSVVEQEESKQELSVLEPDQENQTASVLKLDQREDTSVLKLAERQGASVLKLDQREDTSVLKLAERQGASVLKLDQREDTSVLKLGRQGASVLKLGQREDTSVLKLGRQGASVLKLDQREDTSVLKLGRQGASVLKLEQREDTSVLKLGRQGASVLKLGQREDTSALKLAENQTASVLKLEQREDTSALKLAENQTASVIKVDGEETLLAEGGSKGVHPNESPPAQSTTETTPSVPSTEQNTETDTTDIGQNQNVTCGQNTDNPALPEQRCQHQDAAEGQGQGDRGEIDIYHTDSDAPCIKTEPAEAVHSEHSEGPTSQGPQGVSRQTVGQHPEVATSQGPQGVSRLTERQHPEGPTSQGPQGVSRQTVGQHPEGPTPEGPQGVSRQTVGQHPEGPTSQGPQGVSRQTVGQHPEGPTPEGPQGVSRQTVGQHPEGPTSQGPQGVSRQTERQHPEGPTPEGPQGVSRQTVGQHPEGPTPQGPQGVSRQTVGQHSEGFTSQGPQGVSRQTVGQHSEGFTSQGPQATTRQTAAQNPEQAACAQSQVYKEEDLSKTIRPLTSNTSQPAQPEAAASQQHSSKTDDNRPVTKHKDTRRLSQTSLARAESPLSDQSDTRSVKSDKARPHRRKPTPSKAPSIKTLPSSRASSVAGETLEPCGRIPALELIPGKEYGVYIQLVESPWLLWVQPFSEDFDDLIDRMSTYYEHLGPNDARRNLDSSPVVGMYVCSRYSANGDWYRAIITRIYQLKGEESRATYVPMVRVFYVDFGNSEDRSVEDIRPLLKKFSELPAHAVPCALAEVAPVVGGDQWTKKESLGVLLTLKTDESEGLKHAVFSYEPGCALWFVHIYVPQAVPGGHPQSGPITREMICVSEHLVDIKLARRLPNSKVVKQLKRMKLTERVSEDLRYVATSRMEPMTLISTLSPVQPGLGDTDSSKSTQGEERKTSQGPSGPYDQGDFEQPQAKSRGSPDTSENLPNVQRSKYSPRARKAEQRSDQGPNSSNKQGESQANLYQEWAQAWKKVSDPVKDKQPAVQCSTSLSNSALSPDDAKSQNTEIKTEIKAETQERTTKGDHSRGSKPSARRPASDHQHVRIPLAEVEVGPDQRVSFLMSHIESPSLFFIHLVAEKTQLQLDCLAESLEEYYGEANLTTMQRYFHSGNLEVHDACVAFYSEDNSYYRAEILNTSRPSRTSSGSGDSSGDAEQVEVLYVDYGNREWVSLNMVYPIQPKLSSIPAQAVCCCLSNVTPVEPDPEVMLSYDHGGWLKEAIHWFFSNTGYDKQFVGTVEETSGTKHYSLTAPLAMLLVDETDDDGPRCLNLELARLGMAQVTELPQMAKISLGSPQKPAGSPTGTESSALDEWRPMEEDFLSMRNSYLVDTEDAGVALTGYKCVGDKTICRYYARGMRCWLGALCRDKHVRPNPDVCEDQVPAVVMYSDENIVALPEVNTWVRMEVLSVINPSRFYAYLPYGVLPIHADDDDSPPAAQEFLKLRDQMTEFYEEHPFEHQDLTLYAEGEIVATKSDDDHYWYRCKVIAVDPDNSLVKVFFLDFGNTMWQKERQVKQIDTQFLFVPFQAIECHLEIKPTGDVWTRQAINEFVNCVDGKELVARVMERFGTRLTVDLNDTANEGNEVNLADRFIQMGHARRIIPPKHTPGTLRKKNKRYRMVPG